MPDGVRACLFDLDGVLTETASVHAAAWKEMFDDFLRRRAGEHGQPFVPFDPHDDYDQYVDGKPRLDGVRDFLASRGIHLPEGTPDDPPDADTVHGLGRRKNDLVLRRIRDDGVEAYPGSVAYVRAAEDAGLRRAVVSSSSQLPRRAGRRRDRWTSSRSVVDGVVAEREHLPGKPAPDTFLAAARHLGVEPAAAAVFEDALAGVGRGPGRALRLRRRRRPGRPGRGPARPTAPTGWSRTSPSCSTGGRRVIDHPASGATPWSVGEDRAQPGPAGPDRVGVRPLQRPHRLARQPGRGRAARPAGHLPRLVLRAAAPAVRRSRSTATPTTGQTVVNVTNGKIIRLLVDDEPFDIRYGELRHHRAGPGPPGRHAQRTVEWVSPGHKTVRVRSTRLVSFTQRSIAAICYEVEAVDSDVQLVIQSELVANEELPAGEGDPRGGQALDHPLVAEAATRGA